MSYLLSHTAALVLLAAVVWLAGWAIEQLASPPLNDRRLRGLARICLGLGFWVVVLFALAAVGALQGSALLALAALVAGVALWARRAGAGGSRNRRRRRWRPPDRPHALTGAVLGAILVPAYLLAISPAVSWDASVYHLTLPKLFVDAQGFRDVPFNVYAHWPLATELLFAAAMMVQDYVLAKLVHFGFGLLTLYALFLACRRFYRPVRFGGGSRQAQTACGALAVALFLANPVVIFELRVAYVDLAYAFLWLAGFLWLMRARGQGADADRALLLAGLCGGLIAGVKLNGIVGALILGALYLPELVRRDADERWKAWKAFGQRFVLPVLALWAPWLIKSAWSTGNPVYPLLFGGPYWSPAVAEQLAAWHRSIGMGREPIDYLLLPLRVILAGGPGYQRFDGEIGAFWIFVLPLALWACWHHWLPRRALAAAGLYFVFWALTSQQMRLLIPILPLLSLAGAVAVLELAARLPGSTGKALGRRLALFGALALLISTATAGTEAPRKSRYAAAAGKALGRYLNEPGDLRATAIHPVYQFINGQLPDDARLLFLNTNQGFFCDREYIADSFFEASQIADWLAPVTSVASFRERLAEERITHLLIKNRDWGIAYPPALAEMLRDPSQIELLWTSPDGFNVVALR